VRAVTVVKLLNVIAHKESSRFPVYETIAMNELDLKREKEALRYRVIVAVPKPAHAWGHAVGLKAPAKAKTRVLTAPIRVVHQIARFPAPKDGHIKSPAHKFGIRR
jgi:hypothetical protein